MAAAASFAQCVSDDDDYSKKSIVYEYQNGASNC